MRDMDGMGLGPAPGSGVRGPRGSMGPGDRVPGSRGSGGWDGKGLGQGWGGGTGEGGGSRHPLKNLPWVPKKLF